MSLAGEFPNLKLEVHSKVLDVGCGDGALAAWIALQTPEGRVVGVDRSAEAIAGCRNRYPAADYPNLHFRVADALELDLGLEPFDVVVSRACLHHLEHPGHAFAPIAAQLNVGGQMHVKFLGKGNGRTVFESLARLSRDPKWQPYFQGLILPWAFVDPRSCSSWLREAGLKKKQARLEHDPVRFDSVQAFLTWFLYNFRVCAKHVPADLENRFFAEWACQFCSSYGPVDFDRVWLVIHAEKRGQPTRKSRVDGEA